MQHTDSPRLLPSLRPRFGISAAIAERGRDDSETVKFLPVRDFPPATPGSCLKRVIRTRMKRIKQIFTEYFFLQKSKQCHQLNINKVIRSGKYEHHSLLLRLFCWKK